MASQRINRQFHPRRHSPTHPLAPRNTSLPNLHFSPLWRRVVIRVAREGIRAQQTPRVAKGDDEPSLLIGCAIALASRVRRLSLSLEGEGT